MRSRPTRCARCPRRRSPRRCTGRSWAIAASARSHGPSRRSSRGSNPKATRGRGSPAPLAATSRSVPSSGLKTKPRIVPRCGSSGLERRRARLSRSVASTSANAPSRHDGSTPSDASAWANSSSDAPLQPAAVVHHHDDVLGAEQPLRDAQRADRVVGHQAAGVADDVRVAALQAEHREQVDARVHAGEHRDLALRPRAQTRGRELIGALRRSRQHVVRIGHAARILWSKAVRRRRAARGGRAAGRRRRSPGRSASRAGCGSRRAPRRAARRACTGGLT